MLKKLGIASVVVGLALSCFGIWMVESSSPFDYWGHSSGMRSVMEFAPWFMVMLGVLGILAGIFYLVQGFKPIIRKNAKVIEKNGAVVTFEFEDGSRKNLTLMKTSVIVGDEGTIGYQGNFAVEFTKRQF